MSDLEKKSETVSFYRKDNIAVVVIDNPPVNSLSNTVRSGLYSAFSAIEKDEELEGAILIGANGKFCGGADIRQFNTPAVNEKPMSREVIQFVESMSKPVVAAIEGFALGGGLEIALGCHYRVAHTSSKLGLPEVALGLIPGGGGTQRLPRLIGVSAALSLIQNGKIIPAKAALDLGIVDAITEQSMLDFSLSFIRSKLSEEKHPVLAQVELKDDVIHWDERLNSVKPKARNFLAQQAVIRSVKSALNLSFDEGLDAERSCFNKLVAGTTSKALRHLFFAEKAAQRSSLQSEHSTIKQVAVLGAGTMGVGIAMAFINAGFDVLLGERNEAALQKGIDRIKETYAVTVSKGRLSQEEVETRLTRIQATTDMSTFSTADLIIEAVFEDMAVKKAIFADLDNICKAEAILATNTSRLDINEIANSTTRPESVIGLHFFSPANVMKLLEIVKGEKTTDSVVIACLEMAKRIGKVAVVVGVCEGFVGNRMLTGYWREAGFLLEEGASPEQVDQSLMKFGMAMGPLTMADLAGMDINWATRKRLEPTRPKHLRYSKIADRICELGRFGQKTQAGYYRYEPGSRTPIPDPIVDDIIQQCADEAGIKRRTIPDEEVIERCMMALINEGMLILEEGIAQRASDIDLVYVYGYGFPAWRGGPMFYAQTLGLSNVLDKIKALEAEFGAHWKPAPLLEKMVRLGQQHFE